MTGRCAAAAVAVAALALVAPGPAAARDGRRVRVFAVQPKLDLAWMQSRQTFRDKMLAISDRRLRGAGSPLVQSGADDFASHLLGPTDPARPVETARDLVVWPEDIGLFAALTGQRAQAARNSGSLTNSIVALLAAYAPQNAYYSSKFPAVAARTPQVRLLALSLTDTFAHVGVETFSEIARRYHVWLEAGIDMAQDWKVVCNDIAAFNSASPPRLPDGELCQEQDPQRVHQLGDPFDPSRDYAYEAVTAEPSNMALVFDPAGRLRSKQVKTYLTPTELPGQLDLVPGEVSRGLSAVRTPVGTLGFVTSKDAWMPDVQDKLDEQHVDVLVQPEFFVGDTVDDTRMWSPDTMLGAGYADVLRMPSLRAMVEPDLVGNVFEFSADAQSHIAVKPHGARARVERAGPPGGATRRAGPGERHAVGGGRPAEPVRAVPAAPPPPGRGGQGADHRVGGAVPGSGEARPVRERSRGGRAVARRDRGAQTAPAALPRPAGTHALLALATRAPVPARAAQRRDRHARPPRRRGLGGAARRAPAGAARAEHPTAAGAGRARCTRPAGARAPPTSSGRRWPSAPADA